MQYLGTESDCIAALGELAPHAFGHHSLLSADVVFNGILPPKLPQEIFYPGSAEQIVSFTE